ncbi:MAG: hypothetical protein ABL958_05810 [Bdellovibrionia bacterium]
MKLKITAAAIGLVQLLTIQTAIAATTKVGNGDDGTDLEGFAEITSGPIFESQKAAADHLKKMNVQGIAGLGVLIPEVEKAQLFLAQRDVQANLGDDQGTYHTDFNGLVFARSLPEAHAPTRFFPAAKKLTQEQLIALHIHEGLHRSLPLSVREDESKVAQLTLAITSPGSNHDRIRTVAEKHIPAGRINTLRIAGGGGGGDSYANYGGDRLESSPERAATVASNVYPIADNPKVSRPSILAYTYQGFTQNNENDTQPVDSMQTFQSVMYPFGTSRVPIGLGIEASFLKFKDETQMGPLGLSFRMRVFQLRGFDIGTWATASLNTLSSDELKNSPYGRDVFSTGISLRKDLPNAYVENLIGVTSSGKVEQKLGNVKYTHDYGSVVNVTVKAGLRRGHLLAGGFGEILLADNYRLTGPNFEDETGRYQIFAYGPDLGWEQDFWAVRVFGRFIGSSTKNANFTTLGNLMGKGAGQGSIGAQLSLLF